MSAKPTLAATFDSNATHCIAPLSGHVSDGFVNNEVIASGELNEILRRFSLYCDYLKDGDIELDGVLLPSGNLAISNSTQTITPAAGVVVTRLTGGGASAVLKGITAGVAGRVVILQNQTGQDVTLSALDAGAGAGTAIAINDAGTATVRLPAGASVAFRYSTQWECLWSSCTLVPATRTIPIDISKGQIRNPSSGAGEVFLSGSVRYLHQTSGLPTWQFSVEVPVGATITEVVVGYNRNSAASVSFELARWSMAGSETIVAGHTDTTSTGDITTAFSGFSGSLLPFVTQASETLSINLTPDAGGKIYAMYVVVKAPVP